MDIVSNKELKRRLRYARDKQLTFDDFVKRHQLEQAEFVKEIPWYYRENIEHDMQAPNAVEWLNNENEIDELVAWDYLADALCISMAAESENKMSETITQMAQYTMMSRVNYRIFRILLSIIVYTDAPDDYFSEHDGKPNGPFHPSASHYGGFYGDSFIENAKSFMRGYYEDCLEASEICQDINSTAGEIAQLKHTFSRAKTFFSKYRAEVFRGDPPFADIYRLNLELLDVIVQIENNPQNDVLVKTYKAGIDQILKKIIRKLKQYLPSTMLLFGENINYKEVLSTYVKDNVYNTHFSLFKVIVKQKNDNVIQYYCDEFTELNQFLKSSIETALKGKVGKKIREKYGATNSGCFAIMKTENESFFSLSGAKEVHFDKNIKNQIYILADYIKTNILKKGTYHYVPLSEKTMRYTDIIHDNRDAKKAGYIAGKITWGEDRTSKRISERNQNTIAQTFGCCERKMLVENITSVNKIKEVYSRWAPCWKCQPAVYELIQNVPFYAFDIDFTSWQVNPKTVILKKYSVNIGYSVKAKV